ncbi:MAG: ClpXP protease specificity-enhancing factor [Nitrosomonas sp. PRO4]|nr:ClpXP protease specificity-enhancing factor [Nitrosomonas sp. PRO4]
MNLNNSTKPYLIRSIYDWCIDNDLTPFISVEAFSSLNISTEYINNGEVILNISSRSAHNLMINNDFICFVTRFNGISKELEIPIDSIKAIFAKEVNQGIMFNLNTKSNNENLSVEKKIVDNSLTYQSNNKKTNLRIIK